MLSKGAAGRPLWRGGCGWALGERRSRRRGKGWGQAAAGRASGSVPPCELCEEIEGVLLVRGKFAQGAGPVLGRLGEKRYSL